MSSSFIVAMAHTTFENSIDLKSFMFFLIAFEKSDTPRVESCARAWRTPRASCSRPAPQSRP